MTIDEAIQILSDPIYLTYSTMNKGFPDSLKLGIEALKRIKEGRCPERTYVCYLLPGEAPEPTSKRSLHHIRAVLAGNEVSK